MTARKFLSYASAAVVLEWMVIFCAAAYAPRVPSGAVVIVGVLQLAAALATVCLHALTNPAKAPARTAAARLRRHLTVLAYGASVLVMMTAFIAAAYAPQDPGVAGTALGGLVVLLALGLLLAMAVSSSCGSGRTVPANWPPVG
jgi:hypothetical protein